MNDDDSSTAEFTRRASVAVGAIDALRQSLVAIAALPGIDLATLDRLAFIDEFSRKTSHAVTRHTLDIAMKIPCTKENTTSATLTPGAGSTESQ
jgi:hypothetical protein